MKGNEKVLFREKGTPQGGVISPILANLFLHYVFDKWRQKYYPRMKWCRYADDGLVHCQSEAQAREIWQMLETVSGNVDWYCIRTKPGLLTVRMSNEKENMNIPVLIFWDIPSDQGGSRTVKETVCL